jgi:uncharacterized protein YjbJ (UPF0337 family)
MLDVKIVMARVSLHQVGKEPTMNWHVIRGKWAQFKGEAKQKWAKLTDDDLGFIAGEREKLVGKIVERYGVFKDDAERQIDAWLLEAHHKAESEAEAEAEVKHTEE